MIRAWGITDKGAVRTQNQDAWYLDLPSAELAVGLVCDGMGGAKAGNIASMVAVETFVDALQGLPEGAPEEPEAVLQQAAERANTAVYHRAATDPDCRGMGTTLVAALVVGTQSYLLNIGDSRAYHVSEDGIAKVTRDHSVVEELVIRGDITPEEARVHPQKNLITRVLGAEEKLRADSFRQLLKPGEFLLLCSDGLSNMVSDQEILYEIIHGGEPEGCCQRLLEIAMSRGAPDNVTAVLFQQL
ncbi:protein-serine/threonine phosphatase [Oscillospiraceae bacterium]|nr:protein-serine/threonine phosphatase [Oscillospiraceae bacterium]BDF74947.1 protein-serine/threonine phosphatase [Oscillospiraceae bacterium]